VTKEMNMKNLTIPSTLGLQRIRFSRCIDPYTSLALGVMVVSDLSSPDDNQKHILEQVRQIEK
jgi:hypothetical protein